MKLVAIMGGGDWYDASVEFIEIPDNMNLDEMRVVREKWYLEEYCPGLRNKTRPKYLSFVDFLKKNGAVETDKIEIYWD